jgi:peroxiredoxin
MMIFRGWALVLTACGAAAVPPHETGPVPAAAPAERAPPGEHAEAAASTAAARTEPAESPDSLVGVIDQPVTPWTVSQWFNSPPLTLEQLRGKVVLVRWFTDPSCPFCSATAPTLRALHERYADKGLAVIGMFHHKEPTPLDPKQVEGWVKHFGYKFPVAIDKDWTTLRRWWLDGHERSYTSVSFLIDKAGVVRRVHLGGTIAPEGEDINAITADVERLLAQ